MSVTAARMLLVMLLVWIRYSDQNLRGAM